MDKNMRPSVVSIDWLTVNGDFVRPLPYDDTGVCQLKTFRVLLQEGGTKQWAKLATVVTVNDIEVGTLAYEPRSKQIPAARCLFKLANARLYEQDPVHLLSHFLIEASIKYHGITRLDIAYDSNDFYGGLLATSLIRGYMDSRFLKVGLRDAWAFVKGSNGAAASSVESLTFGRAGQAVQVVLYNKSRELAEVADKPYIRDLWQHSGLDLGRDVWRVEIRLRGKGLEMVQLETGQPFRVTLHTLCSDTIVAMLFHAAAAKYFQWYRNDGRKKVQNNPPLKVLCFDDYPLWRPKRAQERHDASPYLRGVVSLLHRVGDSFGYAGDKRRYDECHAVARYVGDGLHAAAAAKAACVEQAYLAGRMPEPLTAVTQPDTIFAGIDAAALPQVIAALNAFDAVLESRIPTEPAEPELDFQDEPAIIESLVEAIRNPSTTYTYSHLT